MPPRSQYYDAVADLRFQMNSMSPEEVVPFFYPQIYNISDPNLSDAEFPAVSILSNPLISIFCLAWNAPKKHAHARLDLFVLRCNESLHFHWPGCRPITHLRNIQSGRLRIDQHAVNGGRNLCQRRRVGIPDSTLQFNKSNPLSALAFLSAENACCWRKVQWGLNSPNVCAQPSNNIDLLERLQPILGWDDSQGWHATTVYPRQRPKKMNKDTYLNLYALMIYRKLTKL